ncbi:inositol pentakisphosphate 2-kinase [Saccharomycopsis crataegensis]|uniref:Inositol-pentakisphosphate 2-kinase n=1 Tax=Saccharomycopsis crataegensis TaxID=43959 RepID=A0AAV5QI47_9ASCO|nr:inositol pentakisphosphate 2-kinase [Saccharomycopsis crataegensis]
MVGQLDASEWRYFAKGNANVLLQNKSDSRKLLRLRQYKPSDYQSTIDIYRYINSIIAVILKDFVVPMELLELSPTFSNGISNLLKTENRNCDIETQEKYGILMDNCLSGVIQTFSTGKFAKLHISNDSVTLELKPKWLDPTITTLYCRNCANEKHYEKSSSRNFCSSRLLSKDKSVVLGTVRDIFRSLQAKIDTSLYEKILFQYFVSASEDQNILQLLSVFQNQNDNRKLIKTLESEKDVTDDLLLGMALRDVTIFFKFIELDDKSSNSKHVRGNEFILGQNRLLIKVVDIDNKSAKKWKYWKDTECELLDSKEFDELDLSWGPGCVL